MSHKTSRLKCVHNAFTDRCALKKKTDQDTQPFRMGKPLIDVERAWQGLDQTPPQDQAHDGGPDGRGTQAADRPYESALAYCRPMPFDCLRRLSSRELEEIPIPKLRPSRLPDKGWRLETNCAQEQLQVILGYLGLGHGKEDLDDNLRRPKRSEGCQWLPAADAQ